MRVLVCRMGAEQAFTQKNFHSIKEHIRIGSTVLVGSGARISATENCGLKEIEIKRVLDDAFESVVLERFQSNF